MWLLKTCGPLIEVTTLAGLTVYTHLSLHCGYVPLCDMSVSKPLVTLNYNGTTCVNMVVFLHVCFEGYC